MPFDIQAESREGYVFLTAAGEVTPNSILELGSTIHEHCAAEGKQGVIIDSHEMVGALPVSSLINVTQEFVKRVGPGIKVAYINPPAEWTPEDDQFSRNVANNRGGALEVFGSEGEAREWLRS